MSSKSEINSKAAGINWVTAIWMVIFHLGAIAAPFMFSWKAVIVALALWWIAGSPGVGMGFHRLLTHRGYKTSKAVEYFLTVCGTLALEGGAINWVVTHRIHHAHTDSPGDPHTPRDGGWWAHMGWILTGTALIHDSAVLQRYAPDLMKDRFQRWHGSELQVQLGRERQLVLRHLALGVVQRLVGTRHAPRRRAMA